MDFKFNPQRIETSNGHVAYAIWDKDIEIWEVCSSADGEGYFGCAMTLAKAKKFVEKWFK